MREATTQTELAFISDVQSRRIEKIRRELGPTMLSLLEDPLVVEIMVNADGALWVERLGSRMTLVEILPKAKIEALIHSVTAYHQTVITSEHPLLECVLPGFGARFAAAIQPVVTQATFCIRCKASQVFTLNDYVNAGILQETHRQKIQSAIRERQNILIVGGTGSGKTTLANALVSEIVQTHPDHRLVIIEDTPEIQCTAQNAVLFQTSDYIDLPQLLKSTLRYRPDRILVGEVRGGEALTLVKAWNTGHSGGLATIHANSASAGLIRLEQLIAEATLAPMHTVIAEAIDLIIFITKTDEGRKVSELISLTGYSNQAGYLITKL
jgi:type IV secretion system protein TrbB